MKEDSENVSGQVDQQYVETAEGSSRKKGLGYGWGFYILIGCVLFALYEIIASICYFF